MARISLEIPDELLQQLAQSGRPPTEVLQEVLQERLLEVSSALEASPMVVRKFQRLAAQWRRETQHLSLVSDIVLNTAYQQIIGMGSPVVGLILQDLQQKSDHWLWALRSITGENPIQPDHRGRLAEMAEAWLEWGRQHGYQC
jgi:hypothetical protein